MKKISLLVLGCMISIATYAYEPFPTDSSQIIAIDLSCKIRDTSKPNLGTHRTPVQIPNVYLDQETGILYFENPCYECTLELVIPGTDTAVYTSAIEDGAETFQIPNGFIGTYELHIHRGNYCFWGEIEL